MLNQSFYNLTAQPLGAKRQKRDVTVSVEDGYGGTRITFTDEQGDELQVVVPLRTAFDLAAELTEKAGNVKAATGSRYREGRKVEYV